MERFNINKAGIYKITNIVNGRVYVGSTQCIRLRRNNHFSDLRNNKHKNQYLQNSFNKYGESNFNFEVLEYVENIEDLIEKETFWVKKLKALQSENGFNLIVPAESSRGYKQSDEVRIRISKAKKGKKINYHLGEESKKFKSEFCKKQNLRQYHTEEIEKRRKENAAKANKKRGCPKWQRDSISLKNRGEKNGMAKLKEDDVRKIKKLLRETNLSQQKIADQFNISRKIVGNIKLGKYWKHVK